MTTVMHKELAAMPTYSSHPEQWHKLWVDFPGAWKLLVKRYAQRLQESFSSLHEVESAEDAQFEYGSSDIEGLPRTVVSSLHQIVDWPCTWPEFMEYEDLLHPTRDGTVHVRPVNVVFITGCDLCTTCLTRARSVWNGACCIRSL